MTDISAPIADTGGHSALTKVPRDSPFVKRLRHFMELTRPDLEILHAVIECEQQIQKRRDLVLDSYEFCKLGFIKSGFAARYKLLRNGKRQIVNFLMPGDIVGMPGSFLKRAVCSVTAVSEMKLQVCAMEAFVGLCYRRPQFSLALSWLAVQEASIYAEHIIDIGRRTPLERLAHLLLEIHSRLAMVGMAEETAFDLPFTQELMSDALGLSVPHLNRTMAKLRAEGLITVAEHHIEFPDISAIAQVAQFQPVSPVWIPSPRSAVM